MPGGMVTAHHSRESFGLVRDRLAWWAMLYVLAVTIQLAPVLLGVVGDRSGSLFGDEPGYWQLARSGLLTFLRPPGYPLFVRSVQFVFGESVTAVIVAQCFVAAFRPLIVALILRELGLRSRAGHVLAIGLTSLSFTGVSLSKRILADSVFGVLVPLAVLLILRGMRGEQRSLWLSGHGVCDRDYPEADSRILVCRCSYHTDARWDAKDTSPSCDGGHAGDACADRRCAHIAQHGALWRHVLLWDRITRDIQILACRDSGALREPRTMGKCRRQGGAGGVDARTTS